MAKRWILPTITILVTLGLMCWVSGNLMLSIIVAMAVGVVSHLNSLREVRRKGPDDRAVDDVRWGIGANVIFVVVAYVLAWAVSK